MDSVTEEEYEKLLNDKQEKETILENIKTTSIEDMWTRELKELNKSYKQYQNNRIVRTKGLKAKIKKKTAKKNTKKSKK